MLIEIVLFHLILYVPSTIFQLCRNGSSWVEPVLSQNKCVLLKDTMQWHRWDLNLRPLCLKSNTLPLSHCTPFMSVKLFINTSFNICFGCFKEPSQSVLLSTHNKCFVSEVVKVFFNLITGFGYIFGLDIFFNISSVISQWSNCS